MLVLRILVPLLVIAMGAFAAIYLLTKDRRWLRYSWLVLKLGLIIVLILIALLAIERLAIVL